MASCTAAVQVTASARLLGRGRVVGEASLAVSWHSKHRVGDQFARVEGKERGGRLAYTRTLHRKATRQDGQVRGAQQPYPTARV